MNQEELEYLFSKKHLAYELREDIQIVWLSEIVYGIESYRSITYSYESKNQRVAALPDSLDVAMSMLVHLLKCEGKMTTIQAVATGIARDIGGELLSSVITASELLAVCEGSVYELVAHNYPSNKLGTLAVEPKIKPSESTLAKINKYSYLPPNLEVPKWLSNYCGGMKTAPDSVVLGAGNTHSEYQALDAVNMLQEIKWELDKDILLWEEEPSKPLDTPEKAKQYLTFKKASKELYELYRGRQFYFIWKFDKRGRMYSNGYHINLQSTDYKKAALSFAHKEVITTH